MFIDFSDITIEPLTNGYTETEITLHCLFCDKELGLLEVFQIGNRFFIAKKVMQQHIKEEHGSVFEALLHLDKKHTGLSEVQTKLLRLFAKGWSDKGCVIYECGMYEI